MVPPPSAQLPLPTSISANIPSSSAPPPQASLATTLAMSGLPTSPVVMTTNLMSQFYEQRLKSGLVNGEGGCLPGGYLGVGMRPGVLPYSVWESRYLPCGVWEARSLHAICISVREARSLPYSVLEARPPPCSVWEDFWMRDVIRNPVLYRKDSGFEYRIALRSPGCCEYSGYPRFSCHHRRQSKHTYITLVRHRDLWI